MPPGHGRQLDAPRAAEAVPAEHVLQVESPMTSAYVPCKHIEHVLVLAEYEEAVPSAHSVQERESEAFA